MASPLNKKFIIWFTREIAKHEYKHNPSVEHRKWKRDEMLDRFANHLLSETPNTRVLVRFSQVPMQEADLHMALLEFLKSIFFTNRNNKNDTWTTRIVRKNLEGLTNFQGQVEEAMEW